MGQSLKIIKNVTPRKTGYCALDTLKYPSKKDNKQF
jgi:hypothetical protein